MDCACFLLSRYVIKHLSTEGEGRSKKTKETWIELVDVGGTSVQRNRWEEVLQNSDGIFYFMAMTDFAETFSDVDAKDDYYAYLNSGHQSNITLEYVVCPYLLSLSLSLSLSPIFAL